VSEGALLEHAEVFGNRYGSPRAPVEAALAEGRDVLFDIDWQGAQQLRESPLAGSTASIFILPPSRRALVQRLTARGQDDSGIIQKRMEQATAELSHYVSSDYLIVNNDFDRALDELQSIIRAERLRTARQEVRLGDMLQELLDPAEKHA